MKPRDTRICVEPGKDQVVPRSTAIVGDPIDRGAHGIRKSQIVEMIGAAAAGHDIRAGAPVLRVVTDSTVKGVVAILSAKIVVARAARQRVAACSAEEEVRSILRRTIASISSSSRAERSSEVSILRGVGWAISMAGKCLARLIGPNGDERTLARRLGPVWGGQLT